MISFGAPTDSDTYGLFYLGDQLVQVLVYPYMDNGGLTYCLAATNQVAIDWNTCSAPASCNQPCALQQGVCSSNESCGPTQMTMCDETTRTFSGCTCSGTLWSCDGSTIDPCPADAGAD